ncbi:MAG: hypothetical protein Q9M33_07460 [Robiginitomaculum sp.]|nr:hypothetical protein [Robiginitomaculum sp.]MDQ7077620.1 hypothetical protein [Robiginitomaculum sp.]
MPATTAKVKTLRMELPSLFSQRLIALYSDGSTQLIRPGGLIQTDVLVVSRAQCSFKRISLPNGSRNAVRAALLQAKREASSEANISQIEQDPSNRKMAGLWTWAVPQTTADLNPHPTRSIPETLARQPMQAGLRLVKCLEGVEGQVWEEGALVASRWWPDVPRQGQWITFLRSARIKTDEHGIAPPPLTEVPWRTNLPLLQSLIDALQTFATPGRLFMTAGIVLAVMFMYSGAQYIRYTQTLKNLQTQITARKEVVSDVLQQRNQAIQNLKAIDKMANIGVPTALLSGLAGILEKVQGKDTRIVRFSLSDNQLLVKIKGEPDLDGAALVKSLEDDPALEKVSVNFRPNKMLEISSELSAGNVQ